MQTYKEEVHKRQHSLGEAKRRPESARWAWAQGEQPFSPRAEVEDLFTPGLHNKISA